MKRILVFMCVVFFGVSSYSRAVTYESLMLDEALGVGRASHQDGPSDSYALEDLTYSGTGTGQICIEENVLQLIGTSTDTFDLSAAAYDTMGEIIVAINALTDWFVELDECDLLASEDSGYMYNVSTTSIGSDDDYDVKIDTNGATATDTYLITKRIPVSSDTSDDKIRLRKILGLPATATDDIEIYEIDSSGNETKLIDWNIGSNSAVQSLDLTANGVGGLDITKDCSVVVRINGTAAQVAGKYLTIIYKKH